MTVVIRPVFGRGNTQAMYKGAVEDNGVIVDECRVSMSVAENSGFWSYIEAQKRAARDVGKEEKGIFCWKLSVQFLDQSGAPALLDGKTSVVTPEAHEFYRNAAPVEKELSSLAVVAETIQKLADSLRDMQRDLAANAKEIAVAAMQPLSAMADRIVLMAKEETGRADVMTKLAFKGIAEAQPRPDVFDGIAKVAPAGVMLFKAIKDLNGNN